MTPPRRPAGRGRYRALARYPRQQWPRLVIILVLTGVASALTALQPLALKLLVDTALGDGPVPRPVDWLLGVLSAEPTTTVLVLVAGCFGLAVTLAAHATSALVSWTWVVTGQRMVRHLTTDTFQRLQRLSLLFHTRQPAGDSLSRLTTDTWSVYTATEAALVSPVIHVLTISAVAFAAWQLDPLLAALSLAVAPALAASARYFGHRLRSRARSHRDAHGELTSFVHQVLVSIPLVQAFNAQARNRRRFDELADRWVRASRRAVVTEAVAQSVGGVITTLGIALVLVVGGLRVLEGGVSLGTLLAFVAYVQVLEREANGLLSIHRTLHIAGASVDRVIEVLESDEAVRDPVRPRRLPASVPGRDGGVGFEAVTYGYEPGRPVLHGVDLVVEPGETVALVGHTGAGKTTLVSLIPRFVDPWVGSVTLDGIDLRELAVRDVRDRVAFVRQEAFVLPTTIVDNIAYGRPGAGRREIEAAAEAANAAEFIERLSDGYDTVVGERGATLSGGQRQRLTIARALLKDAPILVLDEPTSALDAESEALLLEALERLTAQRTVLVIAHRLSTVRHADRVVVMEHGRILEQGTHTDLLTAGGTYARLHAFAFGESEPRRPAAISWKVS
jgi:ATP-binding cassette subfamily B protein